MDRTMSTLQLDIAVCRRDFRSMHISMDGLSKVAIGIEHLRDATQLIRPHPQVSRQDRRGAQRHQTRFCARSFGHYGQTVYILDKKS